MVNPCQINRIFGTSQIDPFRFLNIRIILSQYVQMKETGEKNLKQFSCYGIAPPSNKLTDPFLWGYISFKLGLW